MKESGYPDPPSVFNGLADFVAQPLICLNCRAGIFRGELETIQVFEATFEQETLLEIAAQSGWQTIADEGVPGSSFCQGIDDDGVRKTQLSC